MPKLKLDRYIVQTFDEAVERLVQLREADSPPLAQIDFEFSVENLPEELIAEYRTEAESVGVLVNIAA